MKNIFLSHYVEDDEKVQQIKQRLTDKGYEARNFSVDSTKHKDGRTPSNAVIKRYLEMRIRLSSVFICVIGPKTHTRPWVDFEIQEAIRQGKQIVGIFIHGYKDIAQIPYALDAESNPIIGWNSIEKLGDIIEGNYDLEDINQDLPKQQSHVIQRIKC